MGCLLFLLFACVPLVEIALFVTLGPELGLTNTILIVLGTALLGSFLVRHEGTGALRRGQEKLRQGMVPTDELRAGLAIAVGGLFLLTPGFLTDVVGLGLVFAPTRAVLFAVGGFLLRASGFEVVRSDPMAPGGFARDPRFPESPLGGGPFGGGDASGGFTGSGRMHGDFPGAGFPGAGFPGAGFPGAGFAGQGDSGDSDPDVIDIDPDDVEIR